MECGLGWVKLQRRTQDLDKSDLQGAWDAEKTSEGGTDDPSGRFPDGGVKIQRHFVVMTHEPMIISGRRCLRS